MRRESRRRRGVNATHKKNDRSRNSGGGRFVFGWDSEAVEIEAAEFRRVFEFLRDVALDRGEVLGDADLQYLLEEPSGVSRDPEVAVAVAAEFVRSRQAFRREADQFQPFVRSLRQMGDGLQSFRDAVPRERRSGILVIGLGEARVDRNVRYYRLL